MKHLSILFSCLTLLVTAVSSPIQTNTLTITGIGSGNSNEVVFSDLAFDWILTYTTDNAFLDWGNTNPVYTVLTSQITFEGWVTANLLDNNGLFFSFGSPNDFYLEPMIGKPGGQIAIIAGMPTWDGVSPYASAPNPDSDFSPFQGINTDFGVLDMQSATVSQVTITGNAPVPEPSTLALAAMGTLTGWLAFRRRK